MTQHLTTIAEEASASLAAWRLRESARETKAAARQAKQTSAAPEATTLAGGEPAAVGSKEANALLMAMAAWGSREGVEFMLERGGDLCARNDERMTPALAAISRGNAELAMWMIERPEYQWVGDRYPAGGVQTELRAAISASSLHPQMLDFAKSVAKMRPALWSEPKTRKDRFGKACNEDESLVLKTLAENPKAAAWVIDERPLAAKSILEAAMKNNSSYPLQRRLFNPSADSRHQQRGRGQRQCPVGICPPPYRSGLGQRPRFGIARRSAHRASSPK